MTRRALIEKLSASGDLVALHRAGLIPYKVLMYRDIYLDFQILMKTSKFGRMTAYHEIADRYRLSWVTIQRAVLTMEQGEC